MKLHVIIVALNNAQLTYDALKTLVSPYPFVVHLMDQESHETFEQITNADFDYTYTRFSPRVSLSQAWNTGIVKALKDPECEYIFIPNNDVLFHPLTVASLMSGIDSLGYYMVTGENVAPRYNIDQFMAIEDPGDLEFDKRPITNWREEGPDFSCFMIKPDFVKKIGFFDENFYPAYCEDQDMHVRIVKSGGHAKRLTTAPYYHFGSRTASANTHLSGIIGEGHEKNKGYYRKKWGAEHSGVLDGNGFGTPFNVSDAPLWSWDGASKYQEFYET